MCISIPLVIFDTSALLLMILERVRVLEQVYEILNSPYIPVVTTAVIREMEIILKWSRRGKVRRCIDTILSLIHTSFTIADINDDADESIKRFVERYGGIVVTCDLKLKKELEEKNIKVIYFRESSRRMEL